MAMTIFFLLNGMGVVFLLYVLLNFWNEGHEPKSATRQYKIDHLLGHKPNVFVVTHPISHSANGGLSVIPIEARRRGLRPRQDDRAFVDQAQEAPLKKTIRFSTR